MNRKSGLITSLNISIILLSLIVTICGFCSFNKNLSYDAVNQYGETIKMWGAGVYAYDSYFKAPIFIGSDFTVLVAIIPYAIITFLKMRAKQNVENYRMTFITRIYF